MQVVEGRGKINRQQIEMMEAGKLMCGEECTVNVLNMDCAQVYNYIVKR